MDKPKTTKTEKSKPQKAVPKPVKTADPVIQVHLSNLRNLAELVKDLLELTGGNIISSRGKKISPLVASAVHYIKALSTANCKVDDHHELFRQLYAEHSRRILKCVDNEGWMNRLSTSIKIQIGKGTSFEKRNITMNISVALSNAIKLKEEIDDAKYSNVNDREAAMGSYNYQYVPLFYYRFLTVIRDALGDKHADSNTIDKLIDHYRSPAGLDSSEEESKEEAGAGIADFIKGISGDKAKIDSKGLVKAIEKATSDTSMVSTIQDAVKDMGTKGKKGKEDAFVDMARKIGPVFTNIFESVGGGGGDDDESSGSGESGSSEDSSD